MPDDSGFLSLHEQGTAPAAEVAPAELTGRLPAPWRRPSGIAVGIAGVAVYNWWVVVAVQGKLLTSPDELFSDLEATGRPDATLLQHLDLAAGLIMIVAFLLRGRQGPSGPRREWPWMLAFAASGAVGGQFSYACPEGLSASCRAAEWRLALPLHHYVHVVAGIFEFITLTIAVYLAWQRTRAHERPTTRAIRWTGRTLVIAYPLLGVAYLTDRMGAFVEPIFFIAFSAMVLVEVCEPNRPSLLVDDDREFVHLVQAVRTDDPGHHGARHVDRVLDGPFVDRPGMDQSALGRSVLDGVHGEGAVQVGDLPFGDLHDTDLHDTDLHDGDRRAPCG